VIQPKESELREENRANNDGSDTPDDPLPPLGVLLIPGEGDTASPVTLFQFAKDTEPVESPNVNAFKALNEKNR
jgi:hypothetical protein